MAFILGTWALVLAILFAFGAVCISSYNIFMHLVNYNRPLMQRYVVRILLIVPIYSVMSVLSLSFPRAHLYFDTLRDIWEAVVIYCFLVLILEYCGGESGCVTSISQYPGSIPHIWPLSMVLQPIALTARFLKGCKRWTLQFVVIKPLMALVSLILHTQRLYDDPVYQVFLVIIYNVSVFGALYALLLFYLATRSHSGLVGKNAIPKFLSVKTIIFATYWQGLLISILPNIASDRRQMWNSFILCLEMLFFAILQLHAFPANEFRSPPPRASGSSVPSPPVVPIGKASSAALRNVKDAVNMKDVVKDAYYNFHTKYRAHVRLQEEHDRHEADGDSPRRQHSSHSLSPEEPTTGAAFPPISVRSPRTTEFDLLDLSGRPSDPPTASAFPPRLSRFASTESAGRPHNDLLSGSQPHVDNGHHHPVSNGVYRPATAATNGSRHHHRSGGGGAGGLPLAEDSPPTVRSAESFEDMDLSAVVDVGPLEELRPPSSSEQPRRQSDVLPAMGAPGPLVSSFTQDHEDGQPAGRQRGVIDALTSVFSRQRRSAGEASRRLQIDMVEEAPPRPPTPPTHTMRRTLSAGKDLDSVFA
ncbi:unnamed protein product [Vitrella brassicaformis CCMP3155]|uniref:DUF300-domain-containing protein n=3 Tax=Vitrella brassicaformis TaxID=1169539 RepID=A0A0G4GJW3_VITBC|nr:unnamed protein product [Vitrella brassicaformis CCMP3155]|eukprot:CEM30193.1 unnamed protein product [Vitrella brassicaformis CCMP3155]